MELCSYSVVNFILFFELDYSFTSIIRSCLDCRLLGCHQHIRYVQLRCGSVELSIIAYAPSIR
jgi:hypothetical protein